MNKIDRIIYFLIISVSLFFALPVAGQYNIGTSKTAIEFKVTTWNTEWLSCANYGPTNEELQINNVAAVIRSLNADIIALQEVGSSSIYATIDTVIKIAGSDWGGYMLASWPDNCGQNEGIIYRKSKVQFVNASLITDGGSSYDWSGGRYPVLYNIKLIDGENVIPVSLINIHAKAMGDETSYTRRKNASSGLKMLLDGSKYNAKNVILLGDFNDYLTGTQCSSCIPAESPYKNFMDDTENYLCLTNSLWDPYYASPVIDNIIISNELKDNYKSGSAVREVAVTQSIPNFNSTTSDHTPVSIRLSFTSGGTPECDNIDFSETFSENLGSFTSYSVSGDQTWKWQSIYGATVSGYAGGVTNTNEDWLISQAFDLSDKKTASLNFSHALNYSPVESDIINNHTLWITDSYTEGSPADATWTQLAIPVMPAGNNWTYVASGNIDIPSVMMKKNMRFAFKYQSNESTAGTWEIRQLNFNTTCTTAQVPTGEEKQQSIVFVYDSKIIIENQLSLPVSVYDITGRNLYTSPNVLKTEITLRQGGVYLVKAGNEVFKVMVY